MKKLFVLFAVTLLASCVAHKNVVINSIKPAEIDIDSKIQKVIIVNRTDASGNFLNVVEGIVTGEMPFEDRAAVDAFIAGLNNEMRISERFETQIARQILKGNSPTNAFPEPLDWWTLEGLLREYNADAVLAIELLDSDFIVTESKKVIEKKEEGGKIIKVDEYHASGLANLVIGIRIYDPRTKTILDQKRYKDTRTWEGVALTKTEALAALINKSDANNFLANEVGVAYAHRIAPMPVLLNRVYVGKSKDAPAVEQGARFADVGQWAEAIQIWEKAIPTSPQKEAGILAQNIAVGYEILGDMEKAAGWAQRAYTQFGNRNAKKYYEELQIRLISEAKASDQLSK